MWNLIRSTCGASAVEFALVTLPVMFFIIGIIQTGWIVWANNSLYVAVETAARCGAVNSQTPPCGGNSSSNMKTTARLVFAPLSGATFSTNTSNCAGGAGLVGTYKITIAFVVNLTLTASSCYPTVVIPS